MSSSKSGLRFVLQKNQALASNPAPPPSTDKTNVSSTATKAVGCRKGKGSKKKRISNHHTASEGDAVEGEDIDSANQTSVIQPPSSTTVPVVPSGANDETSFTSSTAGDTATTQPMPTLTCSTPLSSNHSGIVVDTHGNTQTSPPPSNDACSDDLHVMGKDEADLGTIGMD